MAAHEEFESKSIYRTNRINIDRRYDFFRLGKQGIDSLQRSRTYFAVLTGRGYFLVGMFALVFYFLCFLHGQHRISPTANALALGTYWVSSLVWFLSLIQVEFPLMYRFALTRMRLYSAATWFFGFYAIFTALVVPFLYLVVAEYSGRVEQAVDTYSIKSLLGAYGCSLFYSFVLYVAACNIVAVMRGQRCFKLSPQRHVARVGLGRAASPQRNFGE